MHDKNKDTSFNKVFEEVSFKWLLFFDSIAESRI